MIIRKALKKALNIFYGRFRCYKTEWVEDLPDEPSIDTIYIIGGRKHPFYAALTCPMRRCKEIVHLEIDKSTKKRWRMKEHKNGTLTLSPSVYASKLPCRCHYWVKRGRIIWCDLPSVLIPEQNEASMTD